MWSQEGRFVSVCLRHSHCTRVWTWLVYLVIGASLARVFWALQLDPLVNYAPIIRVPGRTTMQQPQDLVSTNTTALNLSAGELRRHLKCLHFQWSLPIPDGDVRLWSHHIGTSDWKQGRSSQVIRKWRYISHYDAKSGATRVRFPRGCTVAQLSSQRYLAFFKLPWFFWPSFIDSRLY